MRAHCTAPARGLAVAFACTLTLGAAAHAQQQELPAAETIVARFHSAVGGTDLLNSHTSMRSSGDFSIPAAGITASFESLLARPNRRAMRVEIPGFGEIRTGFTGSTGWSLSAAEGPRVMQGEEAVQAADDADYSFQFRLPGGYSSMTTVERSSVAGQDCYRVRVSWASGRETFDCYSVESGLLIGSSVRQVMNAGTVEAVHVYEDYRDFHGILMPSKITVRVGNIEQVLTRKAVTFDDVSDAELEAPTEIRALIQG
jgi:zinc protease